MGIIIHAYDNFLFREATTGGFRKMCKLSLVFLTFKLFLLMIINEIIVLFSKLLDEPTVCSIAANYNKSTAQVLLKWALQHDVGE